MKIRVAVICSAVTMYLLSMPLHGVNLDNSKGVFTLKSGLYAIEISSECKYSIRSIIFDGWRMLGPKGYSGTVLMQAPGKFTGVGHTEGGEEKLESFELMADGKNLTAKTGAEYKAKRFILRKISILDNLRILTVTEISAGGLKVSISFEALEDQPIHNFYLFLYCFAPTTKEWMAGLPDGKIENGEFPGMKNFLLQKDIKWASQYDPEAGKGFLIFFPKVIEGRKYKSTFWDVPNTYHKYYLVLNTAPLIKKAYKSATMTIYIKGFSPPDGKWKTELEKNLTELRNLKAPGENL